MASGCRWFLASDPQLTDLRSTDPAVFLAFSSHGYKTAATDPTIASTFQSKAVPESPYLQYNVLVQAQCFLLQYTAVNENAFSLHSSTHTFIPFSILTKHLSYTMAITSAV